MSITVRDRENIDDESYMTAYVNKILVEVLLEDKVVRQNIQTEEEMTEVISCIKLYGNHNIEKMIQMREAALSVIMTMTRVGNLGQNFPAKTLKIIELWTRQAQRPTQSIEKQFDVICCTFSVCFRYLGPAIRVIARDRIEADLLALKAKLEAEIEAEIAAHEAEIYGEVKVEIEDEDEPKAKAVVEIEVEDKTAEVYNDEVNPSKPEVESEEHKQEEVVGSAEADKNREEPQTGSQ